MRRREKKPIAEKELVAIARARFASLEAGDSLQSILTLAERFDRSPAVISRSIGAAFRRGLVRIEEVQSPGGARRVPGLEKQLKIIYPSLHVAIVADSATGNHRQAGNYTASNLLADTVAVVIHETGLLRNRDIISLGTSEIVLEMFRSLEKFSRLPVADVVVISLPGVPDFVSTKGPSGGGANADMSAAALAGCLSHNVVIEYCSKSIFQLAEHKRDAKYSADLCIAGVSALTPGSRLFEFSASNTVGFPAYSALSCQGRMKNPVFAG